MMGRKILFVDCCMKTGEASRTKVLCDAFLEAVAAARPDCCIERLVLKEQELRPMLEAEVERRSALAKAGEFGHPMFDYARQFATANRILVGAPYWDFSFPALLKVYLEKVFVSGITFTCRETGMVGLCRAEKMMFIQAAGGIVRAGDPGEAYLRKVAQVLGIGTFECIRADGMDIREMDPAPRVRAALRTALEAAPLW